MIILHVFLHNSAKSTDTLLTESKLVCVRQQRHETRAFDSGFRFALTAGTIAAPFTGKDFPAIGQQFAQGVEVFVIDIRLACPAKTALRLFANR
jgi:hypothetical protein